MRGPAKFNRISDIWRVQGQLVSEGGFALLIGDPGTGKSVTLRLLAARLDIQRDVSVGVARVASAQQ